MKIVLLGIVLCFVHTIYSQTLSFIDETTLKPIQNVRLTYNQVKIFSDSKGKMELPKLKKNEIVLIEHQWYSSLKLTLTDLEKMNFLVYLAEKVTDYDEMVISASKFEEKKKDVAQPIQVIRSTDLENMNQSSTADVLANTGNILVQKSQLGGGSPIIRGFETNKVLIVVDGVRMNNAIYRGGHLQNVITIDNAMLDKVELVYGPGSVVYGSDALGGVMHFHTKNPNFSLTEKVTTSASAYTRYFSAANGYSGNASVAVGGKKIASFTSFSYNKFDDLRQGAVRNPFYATFGNRSFYVERINGVDSMIINKDTNLQIGSAYTQIDFAQKLRFRLSESIEQTVNIQYSTSSDVPRYDRLTQLGSNGLPRFAEWYYGPQKRLFVSTGLELNKKTKFFDQAKLILAYQNIVESRHDRRFKNNFINNRTEELNIYSLNFDAAKHIQNHELRFGVEAYFNEVNSTAYKRNIIIDTISSLDTRYPDGGSSMFSGASYLTHTWEINDKLILNDGLRFSYVGLNADFKDKTFFPFDYSTVNQRNGALNGNIGLIYFPIKNWRINALFSTGFRAPNVDDLSKVFESVPGTVIVPNPTLTPEYTYNYELGITHSFQESSMISLTGYYTQYKNAITVLPSLFKDQDSIVYDGVLSQVRSMQNASEAYLYGIEANFKTNFTKRVSFTSSLTYTHARIKTDTIPYPLDHIPPVFGKTELSYKVKKFRADFWMMYNGWKRLKDYNFIGEDNYAFATVNGMPAWYTLNVRLTYQIHKAISLQVACENITDLNYRVFSSNISAPGRNFIVTLRGNF